MVVAGLTLVVVPLLGPGGLGLDGPPSQPFGAALSVRAQLIEPVRQTPPPGDGVGVTSAQLLHQFGAVAVLEAPSVRDQVVPAYEVSFLPLVAALGIGVLAEVFRQGAAMRADVEGLV